MRKIRVEEKFLKSCSIWIYVVFMVSLEVFIGFFLLDFFQRSTVCFIFLITIIILIMALILVETYLIKYEDRNSPKKRKTSKKSKSKKMKK